MSNLNNKLTTLSQLKTAMESSKGYIDQQDAVLSGQIAAAIADIESLDAAALRGVKVNGQALTIADKMVDILIASGEENGTRSVNGAAVAVTGLAGLADLVVSACALMARQRWKYALIFPAWSVPLKARNSMVRAGRSVEKAAWRLSRW